MTAGSSEPQQPKRVIGRPFQKGQSGNPLGTSKGVAELRQAAREFGPKAIALFAQVMQNEDREIEIRMDAAERLLNRGYGRPTVGEPDDNGLQRAVIQVLTGVTRGEG